MKVPTMEFDGIEPIKDLKTIGDSIILFFKFIASNRQFPLVYQLFR